MRLLLEGDPSHPIEPHAGLLQAENVATTTVSYSYTDEFGNSQSAVISDALQYYKNNATYTVWAFRGEILRELVAGNPRPIMGNPPTAPAAKRIMVDSLEVAFSPDEIASTTKSLVRLSVFLHGETDDNKQADVNEARLIMHPTVFLRNAELEL
jgi:hypothetical protein